MSFAITSQNPKTNGRFRFVTIEITETAVDPGDEWSFDGPAGCEIWEMAVDPPSGTVDPTVTIETPVSGAANRNVLIPQAGPVANYKATPDARVPVEAGGGVTFYGSSNVNATNAGPVITRITLRSEV